jgi:hypothetical protein
LRPPRPRGRRPRPGSRKLKDWEIDAASYRSQVAALRERWKDLEGAFQGDGGKDLDLARQLIKKLLISPVSVTPRAGRMSWE